MASNVTEKTMLPTTMVGRLPPGAEACAGRPRKPLPPSDSSLAVPSSGVPGLIIAEAWFASLR